MERPHPDLPYPDPSPADKSFAESEYVKTSQGFAEDLPGDKRPQYGPAKEVQVGSGWAAGGLEGQAGVWHSTLNTGLLPLLCVFTIIHSHHFHPDFLQASLAVDWTIIY